MGPYHDTVIPAASNMLQVRAQMLHRIKEHLHQAQNRMKTFANKHKTKRQFEVHDWVFLKLQPYRQQSIALRKNLKLAAKFSGPFQVIEKDKCCGFKLQLPAKVKIHLVFHVLLPKPKLGPHQTTTSTLPEFDCHDQCLLQPTAILKKKVIMRNVVPVIQYLIKWYQLGEEESSWEDQSFINSQFPNFQP
ncbi:uncharacterized protein [Coffea arabica]|uniref:Chromo domain-containing protein n=1 Tax=Coffea arabica TaxID=13443 RepID=A0ABM4VC40_COFAR